MEVRGGVWRRGSCSGQRWLHPRSPSALCEDQTDTFRRAMMDWVWVRQWGTEKKQPYLILHFIFFYHEGCREPFSLSPASVFVDVILPKTLVRWVFSFSLKWQHSLKCDEKTLNLAQKLRHRRTAGRRGCPNTQVELRSRSFGSLNYSKHAKLKKENLTVTRFGWFFFLSNSSV